MSSSEWRNKLTNSTNSLKNFYYTSVLCEMEQSLFRARLQHVINKAALFQTRRNVCTISWARKVTESRRKLEMAASREWVQSIASAGHDGSSRGMR